VAKVSWTPEFIAALDLPKLQSLRANASRLNEQGIVDICNAELEQRKPQKRPRSETEESVPSRKGQCVVGFHFVCANDKGVMQNPDGTFWSGTWVVNRAHVDRAIEVKGYFALHSSKSELSYRQGVIKAWRKAERERQYGEQPTKVEVGIDFLIEPTSEPYQWIGTGSGEKGYNWADG
jgi:hypothetical protein